ncbi:hypothetical protein LDENG_00215270 [Lucifuga dentata]|nr:hypothetical protein LDENG_00215270 [Lucifuga dentata]
MQDNADTEHRGLPIPDWRKVESRAWTALEVQGVGVNLLQGDKVSNGWIADPIALGFRQRHFIVALALRMNTYPTREFLARGRGKEGAACRQ